MKGIIRAQRYALRKIKHDRSAFFVNTIIGLVRYTEMPFDIELDIYNNIEL